MHTFEGKKIRIHHDLDIHGGECIIVDKETDTEIRCIGDDLLDFVANYIRSEKISKLEQMNNKDILGI